MKNIIKDYFSLLSERLQEVIETQEEAIRSAADICAKSIVKEKLVFTFGTGHGAFPAMEMFPRTGTVTGFRPIVESTMISFHRVLGDMGARQYRFIHSKEGYGEAILSSHQIDSEDSMLIFSHSGLNAVTLDIAVGAKKRGLKVILSASDILCEAAKANSFGLPTTKLSKVKRGSRGAPNSFG